MADNFLYWEEHGDNQARFMELWRQGVPTRAMAKQLRISLSTVWCVRRRLELPERPPRNTETKNKPPQVANDA